MMGMTSCLAPASASDRSKPPAKKSLTRKATLRRFDTRTSVSSATERSVPFRCGTCPSTSRTTRMTCFCPFLGGTSSSTTSVERMSPTRSLLEMALNEHSAATSAATWALGARRVPQRSLSETSTTTMTVISRSSTKTFTNGSSMRAETFQSMKRTSSPGE
jgi:hypothetical protein